MSLFTGNDGMIGVNCAESNQRVLDLVAFLLADRTHQSLQRLSDFRLFLAIGARHSLQRRIAAYNVATDKH